MSHFPREYVLVNATHPTLLMVPILQQGQQAFLCCLGAKNEEQESKTTIKNGASKRAGRGWGERKETRADKAVDFENHPLACHA